ncbi:MAG: RNA polymerase factor sigma-54 [Caldimicrobium sp.]|nr:RNA polymerase factor sigma-54 [Caldimicrobium sp.]MCX7874123.1 RNA polymerase factor sigma-54 [Caldimicrobium sp.]MDW8093742.1 RNA polymerase factor sigma-54 [Caldimicrobium sp.]
MIELKNKLQLAPQLILTPQLKILLKILQFNTIELNEYLLQEVQSNPFLEIEFNDLLDRTFQNEEKEIHLTDEFNWEEPILLEPKFLIYTSEEPEDEGSLLERSLGTEETLTEHLFWQLGFHELSPLEREIAQHIIGNLNERGYLVVSPQDISNDLGVPLEQVERIRTLIKTLDPVGVASLDLKECLLEQLKFLGYSKDSLPWLLIERSLEEIPEGAEVLAQKYGCSLDSIQEALDVIKSLEPYPARNFFSTRGIYFEPDLRFFKEEGLWKVEVLRDKNFKVCFNSVYYRFINNKRLLNKAKAKEFLREKLRSAEHLLKALDSRYTTLYKVGKAILETQWEFLEKGIKFFKPLTLKELSRLTNFHESTLSRVISHKYVDTPIGVFPLKFFFSTGYQTQRGESVSAVAIKDYIKEIISQEDPKEPFSDNEISQILLKKYGLKIARRTITKYREELGIPSIRERKRK